MGWPPSADDFARLRETLAWIVERSPWYRRLFDEAGVRVAELRTYDDFRRRVPRTEKTALAEDQRAHPPFGKFLAVPREEITSLHTSPGPIYIPRLAEERGGTPVLVEAIRAMGVRPREVAHVTLSYHVMPGGLRLHRAFEEYGCLVINGGTGASRLQVQIAHDYGATVYAGTPSFLANLYETAREMGVTLPYRLGFSTAEALTPALRRALPIELFDHIGEAQIGPVAGECRAHDGMHLHASDLFCEFLDPETGEPAEGGGVGELVATQLGHHALPLVRYAPRDAYRLLPGACPCGDRALRVAFVGQVGVIRKIKGVLIHPAQIHAVTSELPELGRFQVVVDHPPGERYERAVLRAGTVTTPREPDALRRDLAARLKATVLVQMEVELVPETDIPEAAGPPRFAEAIRS